VVLRDVPTASGAEGSALLVDIRRDRRASLEVAAV
jgi:hypothetical protein